MNETIRKFIIGEIKLNVDKYYDMWKIDIPRLLSCYFYSREVDESFSRVSRKLSA